MGKKAAIAAGLLLVPIVSGCASHRILSAEPESVGVAGQPFKHASMSIGGRSGLSSDGTGYVTRDECRTGDLTEVEVRRNVGQTIVTLITFGIVSPATIYFYCEKPETPPPCHCGDEEF